MEPAANVNNQPPQVPIARPVVNPSKWEKVKTIALYVIGTLAVVLLFYINPTTFAIGFVLGFLFDDFVMQQVEKIKLIVKETPIPIIIGIGVGAIMALQVVLGGASFAYAAYCGSLLSIKAKEKKAAGEISQIS